VFATDTETGLAGIELVLNDDPNDPNRKLLTAQLNAWQWVMASRQFVDAIYTRAEVPLPGGFWNCEAPGLPAQRARIAIAIRASEPWACPVFGGRYETTFYCPPRITLYGENDFLHDSAMSSIVTHEFGHHLTFELTQRDNSAHSADHAEGLADVFAAFLLGDSRLARGIQKGHEATSFQRDLATGAWRIGDPADLCNDDPWQHDTSNHVWPVLPFAWDAPGPKPHRKALPYSGAWWDLRGLLEQAFPGTGTQIAEDLFVKLYETKFLVGLPAIGLASAAELLVVDDTPYFGGDGCIANGTPHRAQIVDAFAGRNLYLNELRRGDADASGVVNVADASFITNYLFLGGAAPSCLDAADTDDDGQVIVTDAVYLLNFLFGTCATPPCPPPPFPGPMSCGTDSPTWEDRLTCVEYLPCEDAPQACP